MKKYALFALILMSALLLGCTDKQLKTEITSFEECVAAGNPVMESYPRQCKTADGTTFTEQLEEPEFETITYEEAIQIAQDSECTEKGTLTETYFYNENTRTWWIDLTMKLEFENDLCYPACVISEETKTAEINWRCTGALPP